MRDLINPWCSEDTFEHEIAYGHMGRHVTSRQHRKHAIALGILSMGRNVCFKKDAAPAPAPDPAIGQAAAQNAALGKEYLDWSKETYADSQGRQDVYDNLINKVVDSQMSAQDKANAWAQQDRDVQSAYRTKYDAWADQDRATQLANQTKYEGWADQDRQLGQDTKAKFDEMGATANQFGQDAKVKFDHYGQKAVQQGDMYADQMGAMGESYARLAEGQTALSDAQKGRYQSTFAPIEDKVANDAMTWDSADRLESEAAKSRADIVSGAAMANQASQRQMASMGVNPMSGRFNATTRANELGTQLAAAGAENTTRDAVRGQAVQMRSQAAQLGQQVLGNSTTAAGLALQARGQQQGAAQAGYSIRSAGTGQAMQASQAGLEAANTGKSMEMQATTAGLAATGVGNTTASLGLGASGSPYSSAGIANTQQAGGYTGLGAGLSAGSAALGSQASGNSSFLANTGIMSQGTSTAMQGYANQGNILNNLYGTQINAWGQQQQANAAQSAGTGQMIGTAAGIAAAFMM